MRRLATSVKKHRLRQACGSHVVEFAAALCLLVGFILIPLIDLAVVPIRWMLAQEMVNDYSRKLAVSESFSDAFKRLSADPSLRTRLQHLGGVAINDVHLRMRVVQLSPGQGLQKEFICQQPRRMPAAWLPDGAKAPCSYLLEVEVNAAISPAITFRLGDMSVPGLTKPIPILIQASHLWGNLARNPSTGNYFVDE